MHTKSVAQLAKGLRERQFSSAESHPRLSGSYRSHWTSRYNSFVTVNEAAALAAAEAADASVSRLGSAETH